MRSEAAAEHAVQIARSVHPALTDVAGAAANGRSFERVAKTRNIREGPIDRVPRVTACAQIQPRRRHLASAISRPLSDKRSHAVGLGRGDRSLPEGGAGAAGSELTPSAQTQALSSYEASYRAPAGMRKPVTQRLCLHARPRSGHPESRITEEFDEFESGDDADVGTTWRHGLRSTCAGV